MSVEHQSPITSVGGGAVILETGRTIIEGAGRREIAATHPAGALRPCRANLTAAGDRRRR